MPFAVKFWTAADLKPIRKARVRRAFKADPLLTERLRAEAGAVLADMVGFAVAFYAGQGSLNPPAEVMEQPRNTGPIRTRLAGSSRRAFAKTSKAGA